VLILYESLFGNTAAIARAVAQGIRDARPDAVVDCRSVDELDEIRADTDLDLLVVGAPTHFWGLTRTVTRTMELQYERRIMRPTTAGGGAAATRRAAATTGMRAVLARLPAGHGRAAAAFDTRVTGPLTGGARGAIARRLERAGYRLIGEPETFLVEAVAGPLRPSEADRARAWGSALATGLDSHDSLDWRQTMDASDDRFLATLDGATPPSASDHQDGVAVRRKPTADITRVVTTAELVVGAVLVARYLSHRPGAAKALVTMGPGGWVSMKGGTVAVRRGSRPWARPKALQPPSTGQGAPLWARVLSAVPLQSLMGDA
jgi:hypothetical protein